ncbi:MAG TPA: alpha/beta hydrolase [Mycobacteriales bacterium]|nr:alpha/beta hydrolase [Mycobacteriales bacterium]
MNSLRNPNSKIILSVLAASAMALIAICTTASGAAEKPKSPPLRWTSCADAPGFDCATFDVPKDYSDPKAGDFHLAVTRLPARDKKHRIGSLFVNFGGPGGTGVRTLKSNGTRLFAALNHRFDIVSWDPRGVGESTPAIDCHVDQERSGPFAQPFMTPLTVDPKKLAAQDHDYIRRCEKLNKDVLPYVSTADTARDLDRLRQAVGDEKLTYLGLSYGTYLGVTYESMFPHSYRALALEGVLDPEQYAHNPIALQNALSAAQERATGRFLQACTADQKACHHFGGDDPGAALDALIARLDRHPLPVGQRTLDGDDVLVALGQGLHSKDSWGDLAAALKAAETGDGAPLRDLADGFYGRQDDGTYRPVLDQFFAISALDQDNPADLKSYLDAGEQSWDDFDHAYYLSGYTDYAWGSYPIDSHSAYRGPFRTATKPVLVIGTTYDPATPYKAAVTLTHTLQNARLITLDGDGHGAYGGESPCIDDAVNRYLESKVLPPDSTHCRQE